ncbi:MAG: site-specific integrase [Actinobacteria bacterium]|nr:site-specific integrase [Actinomycetota bacterium]
MGQRREALTVRQVALEWKARQMFRPTTDALVDWLLEKHTLPFLGDLAFETLVPGTVQKWLRGRQDVLAPSSVLTLYERFHAICNWAVADGLVDDNPCGLVRAPKVDAAPVVPPSPEDVRAIIGAIDDRYRAIVVLAAGTGLRSGECLGLGVDHVNFDQRLVTVERQLVLPSKGAPRLGPPKTRASYRRVPLPDQVAGALRRHLRDYALGPDNLVFTSVRGRPVWRPRLNEAFRAAADAAGVTRRIRFHDLRHFYASLLIHHGESVKVVQARLGHASATETLDTYAHLWPDDGTKTREAVNRAFGVRSSGAAE